MTAKLVRSTSEKSWLWRASLIAHASPGQHRLPVRGLRPLDRSPPHQPAGPSYSKSVRNQINSQFPGRHGGWCEVFTT